MKNSKIFYLLLEALALPLPPSPFCLPILYLSQKQWVSVKEFEREREREREALSIYSESCGRVQKTLLWSESAVCYGGSLPQVLLFYVVAFSSLRDGRRRLKGRENPLSKLCVRTRFQLLRRPASTHEISKRILNCIWKNKNVRLSI